MTSGMHKHGFIADCACECGLWISELVTRQQYHIRRLEVEREEDLAAIRDARELVNPTQSLTWSAWCERHAAAIQRARKMTE